jgi:putative phosphoesterase
MTSAQPQILDVSLKQEPIKTVGLISDTHVPVRAKEIPSQVFKVFEKADYIIHAGDLVDISVIEKLEQVALVLAVHGNMDGPEIRGKLPKTNSLRVFDWKIGVTHDPGTLFGMGKMKEMAAKNNFDVLVYGHTHSPNIKRETDTMFINPGSPTDPTPSFINKPTVALLKISKQTITPEIVPIQK